MTALLEEHYPGSTFVIVPHTGFRNLVPALSQVNADLEPKMAGWPKPSLALVKDNWIGAIEAPAVFPGVIGPDGQMRSPYQGLKFSELADAYLYLGPSDSLHQADPSAEAFRDKDYLAELDRRARIMFGQPFSPQMAIRAIKRPLNSDTGPARDGRGPAGK